MAQAPVLDNSLAVDGAVALSVPKNYAEQQSAGYQDPAFAYAFDQGKSGIPGTFEGDNAFIDAVYAIAKTYKTPPTTPTLTSLSPNTVAHGAPGFLMTLTGTGFTPGSIVVFGTVVEPRVTFVSATTLTVVIYNAYTVSAGTIVVKVRPGGGAADSNGVNFTVT